MPTLALWERLGTMALLGWGMGMSLRCVLCHTLPFVAQHHPAQRGGEGRGQVCSVPHPALCGPAPPNIEGRAGGQVCSVPHSALCGPAPPSIEGRAGGGCVLCHTLPSVAQRRWEGMTESRCVLRHLTNGVKILKTLTNWTYKLS